MCVRACVCACMCACVHVIKELLGSTVLLREKEDLYEAEREESELCVFRGGYLFEKGRERERD